MEAVAKQTTQSSGSFSHLFPSIYNSFTSHLSTCPAQLPWLFQIETHCNYFPIFRYNQTSCLGLSSRACNSDCWTPLSVGIIFLLAVICTPLFYSSIQIFCQTCILYCKIILSFIFMEVYYFFISNSFIIFFQLEFFCLFLWCVILCFCDRVYLHCPGQTGTV